MAQPLTRAVIADLLAATDLPDPVVEFGSLQVEPDQDSDLRPLFAGRDYLGTDMRPGPGVDRVEDLRALTLADGSVGTALCLDTLEHCADPPAAVRELGRVTAPGGACLITSVMLFGIHAYPSDYFRFTPEGFRAMLADAGFDHVSVAGVGDPGFPLAVLGLGLKAPVARPVELAALAAVGAAQARYDDAGKVRVGPLRIAPAMLVRALAADAPRIARHRLRHGLRGGR